LPPISRGSIGRDLIATTLYISNYLFAWWQNDYQNLNATPSPFIHYWSLAVEEQFYILMPFIFMAVANWHGFSIAGRRIAARIRLYIFLSAITIVSALSMVILFETSQNEVYFSLFPRVWEFSLGALAALTLPVTSLKSRMLLLVVRHFCVLAFIASLFVVTPNNFGHFLYIPVIATTLIIFINNQLRFGFIYEKVLNNRVLRFFGKISFSLYLWHWPALIYPQQLGIELSWYSKLLIFVSLVALSAFSEKYIERPFLRIGYMSEFHVSPWLKSRRAMVGILLVLLLSLFVATYQPIIASYANKIQTERQVPFWTPPNQVATTAKSKPVATHKPSDSASKLPKYLGIFGDSTNQCCSATGAFWPRIAANKFGFIFSDYSKPATSYVNDGVGNNGCTSAKSCPSVKGQLDQAKGKDFDLVIINAGIGDCTLAKQNPDELQKSLESLFGDFRSKYNNALIIVTSPTFAENTNRNDCLLAVNPIVSKAAQIAKVKFLNGSNWISNPKVQMTLDGGHLNDVGHAIFGAKFIDWVEKLPEFQAIKG
jgi:peptidoglycan/LPS O-acetylase OafA/YrhL/lysophospholipase L1-like esterase